MKIRYISEQMDWKMKCREGKQKKKAEEREVFCFCNSNILPPFLITLSPLTGNCLPKFIPGSAGRGRVWTRFRGTGFITTSPSSTQMTQYWKLSTTVLPLLSSIRLESEWWFHFWQCGPTSGIEAVWTGNGEMYFLYIPPTYVTDVHLTYSPGMRSLCQTQNSHWLH